ncbi:hypothetical protein H4C80_21445 [Pseudomonas juntendi]|uniref:Uncharacterized protein n=1 Tax=Pseudomonas juntendi TaxID=2666183 RepID=A0A7W2QB97_9PSED|nr:MULTISPECIES: hypothetical protein [Pseudomonas]MBA6099670.1 hypothetical protein [Pseudomonas juntendi]
MAIVFIIALILAWPTYGLSLLALAAFAMLRGYLRGKVGKARAAYVSAEQEAMKAIQQGTKKVPTWLHDTEWQKQLVAESKKAAQAAGMTPIQSSSWFSQHDITDAVLTVTACFERHGFSKAEQIVGTSDFVKKLAQQQLKQKSAKPDAGEREVQPAAVEAMTSQGEYEQGRILFEAGMASALAYKCQEAIEYYSQSIKAHENPAPYINRANLLSKRIRHHEALQDLLMAKRLDFAQEFSSQIDHELSIVYALTQNYRNGVRETLAKPSSSDGCRDIAEALLQTSFEISHLAWEYNTFDHSLLEFHFFNELDNIVKFEAVNEYPEVGGWLADYPEHFIQMKVGSCPDLAAYQSVEARLHTHLCTYDEPDMRLVRRHMLYRIHCQLMVRDFGGFWDALDSECRGVTKEAETFIASNENTH